MMHYGTAGVNADFVTVNVYSYRYSRDKTSYRYSRDETKGRKTLEAAGLVLFILL